MSKKIIIIHVIPVLAALRRPTIDRQKDLQRTELPVTKVTAGRGSSEYKHRSSALELINHAEGLRLA